MPASQTTAIHFQALANTGEAGSHDLLPGEIAGATVVHHRLNAGQALALAGDRMRLGVLFLVGGAANFRSGATTVPLAGKASFIAAPGLDTFIQAAADAEILEIGWALTERDHETVAMPGERFPMVQIYTDSPQYRDYFKSEKTISRTIVGPHVLPRFCMGSVESIGPDRIEPHAHPMLDQLFFSFAENDILLLIDGHRHRLQGNTLLHIPLGSDHGVDVAPGNRMHYLWLDFFQRHEDMDYIAEVHKDVPSRNF